MHHMHHTHTNPQRRHQGGFSLIETLIVLALFAVAVFLVVGRGNEAQTKADVQAEVDFVQSLLPTVRKAKAGASYNGLSATVLINSGLIDQSRISGTSIVNTASSGMTFAAANFNGGTDNAYQITNPGLGRAVCNELAASVGRLSNTQSVAINGTTVQDRIANTVATPATIGAACTDQNNTVVIVGT